jgi:hypothetical protein
MSPWHIANFRRNANLGRYRGMTDVAEADLAVALTFFRPQDNRLRALA